MKACVYFWSLAISTFLAFTDCEKQVVLPEEYCGLKPVVVSVDPSRYQYKPFYVQLYRCQGSCSVSPDVKSCENATVQPLSVLVNPLNQEPARNITMYNHTSCKCNCVQQADGNCGPNSEWNNGYCKCQCMLKEDQCPPGFKLSKAQCKCICARARTQCFLPNGRLDDRKAWNETDCGCSCMNKYYKRCSRKGKILDESNCRCIDPPTTQLRISDQGRSSTEKGFMAATFVLGILCIGVFLFDSYMYHKKIGVLFLCFGKKEQALYTGASTDDIDGKGIARSVPSSNGNIPNGQSGSDTNVYL